MNYRVTVESEERDPQSAVVEARNAREAVAVARARGDLPLDKPATVKFVQYSEKGEIVHRAEPTDESKLQTELLSMLVSSEIIQRPFWAVFWPVAAALGVAFVLSIVISAAFSSGY